MAIVRGAEVESMTREVSWPWETAMSPDSLPMMSGRAVLGERVVGNPVTA